MDVLATPYWQENGSGRDSPRLPLPARVDVLIVGAGYTGLSAARETAAAGAATLVLEAGGMEKLGERSAGPLVDHSLRKGMPIARF